MRYLLPLLLLAASPAFALDCAEGQRAFAHPGGETCIPMNPQRIVTLSDQNGLLPLLELGVVPVGSAGHVTEDGSQIFRRTDGFDTSAVAFVGSYSEPDAEAVAALAPDLIVASTWPEGQMEVYSKIAPTIVFDPFSMALDAALMQIADAVGRVPQAEALRDGVMARAEALRAELGDEIAATTLSFVQPEDGLLWPVNPSQAAGLAFDWLGLKRVPAQAALTPEDYPEVGFESLPDHAGDVMIVIAYDAEGQGGAFDSFLAEPLVQVLPVAQAGQIVRLDGTQIVGAGWGRVGNFIEAVAGVLSRPDLNRGLVTE